MNIEELDITRDGFIAFCKAQGNRLIDNSCGVSAWSNCAVGQYFTHLTGEVLGQNQSELFVEALDSIIDNVELSDNLSNSYVYTYADLVQELT